MIFGSWLFVYLLVSFFHSSFLSFFLSFFLGLERGAGNWSKSALGAFACLAFKLCFVFKVDSCPCFEVMMLELWKLLKNHEFTVFCVLSAHPLISAPPFFWNLLVPTWDIKSGKEKEFFVTFSTFYQYINGKLASFKKKLAINPKMNFW